MALDSAVLGLVASELLKELSGAKIDKIFMPTRDEAVFNMRFRDEQGKHSTKRLFLSARSGSARVCLTKEAFENPGVPPSFCMLLRKHFTGGRLIDIRTVPDERIIFFDFQCTNELGDIILHTIAAELMGRYSNLVLIKEGKITDALKRVDFEDSDIRQLLPGLAYTMPEKPNRRSLLNSPPSEIVNVLCEKSADVADALMKVVGGVGPVICREIAFRVFGGEKVFSDALTPEQKSKLAKEIENVQIVYKSSAQPTMIKDENARPIEFSFMPLTQYTHEKAQHVFNSFSELLEGYYAQKDHAERMAQKSRELAKTVKNAYERAIRKHAARKEEQLKSEKSEHLRVFGELLNANLWAFERGASEVTLQNYYTGEQVKIKLDIRLTPSQNAQKYFKDYKKKQTAAKMLTKLLQDGEREIEYLKSVLYMVNTAQGEQALNEIRAELKEQGYLKYYKPKDKRQKPTDFHRYTSKDGFTILVGRNNAQNDKLTLKTARGKDWWFHVKNAPGSHVVVLSEGKDVSNETKTSAAKLAAFYSSMNAGAKVEVDYTMVKNVRKTNDCKPGMVLYDVYETAIVSASDDELIKE